MIEYKCKKCGVFLERTVAHYFYKGYLFCSATCYIDYKKEETKQ